MTKRRSINHPAPRHAGPLPNASRVGGLIMSSMIVGTADDGTLPDSFEEQIANIYRHVRGDLAAADAAPEHVVHMTFWVGDPGSQRSALNPEWEKMFPDAESRPARYTLPMPSGAKAQVLASFVANVV